MAKIERVKFAERLQMVYKESAYPTGERLFYEGISTIDMEIDFDGASWDLLPLEVIITYRDEVYFFTPEGLHYYLPAFLRALLLHPYEVDTLIYSLIAVLSPSEYTDAILSELVGLSSAAEITLIYGFFQQYLQLFSEEDFELNESEITRIQTALAYWQKVIPK